MDSDLKEKYESYRFVCKEKYEFHRYVMDYLQDSIRFADTKASLILAILGFSLPKFLAKWQDIFTLIRYSHWYALFLFLLIPATLAYLVALGYAIFVFKPRVPSVLSQGYIFFGDIRGFKSVDHYIQSARNVKPDDLLDSVLYQNWILSGIVTLKFRYTSHSVTAGIVWLAMGVFCLLLIPSTR